MEERKDIVESTTNMNIPISISNKESEIFRIEEDGSIFVKKEGETKLQKVETDKEIGLAFAYCVSILSGMNPVELIKTIKNLDNYGNDKQ